MPLLESNYQPPRLFGSGHLQTIYPAFFRTVTEVNYQRERIDTPDGDFLDLDWSRVGEQRLGVISHGLEGNTGRAYVRGMARALNRGGWDALAWNFRGCSGEPNRLLNSYHSGKTEDLDTVIEHARNSGDYSQIALIGFSMGGNLTLKYLGERGAGVDPAISGAVAFSVPCDLRASSQHLARPANKLYMARFIRLLHEKVRVKMQLRPGEIDDRDYHRIKNFKDFDDRYTAPLNGFADAEDYWRRASCKPYLSGIKVPALLINAQNDPFLPPACYPEQAAAGNPHLFLEIPRPGGHVGFVGFNENGDYWSERRALTFISQTDTHIS